MNPSKQIFVNLQSYLNIELYSQFWIHFKASIITLLECILTSLNDVVEIILWIIIKLTDHDKNNYNFVFVPSADLGHFPQIKQTA